ncbi:MAG: DUF4345 domain-containing protein [Gemmatimonadota bacterium]|nr:DUF4345 domain-containing protein [Gemmatimonadota bacterium]
MRALMLTLRFLAVAFIAVAGLHLIFGLQADAMLGSPVSPEMAAQPSFDSQNRFYGVTFSLLGVALLIGATDLKRYRPIVTATLGVLFAAGVARVVAWVVHGSPAPVLIVILVADLLLPPLLYVWIRHSVPEASLGAASG